MVELRLSTSAEGKALVQSKKPRLLRKEARIRISCEMIRIPFDKLKEQTHYMFQVANLDMEGVFLKYRSFLGE